MELAAQLESSAADELRWRANRLPNLRYYLATGPAFLIVSVTLSATFFMVNPTAFCGEPLSEALKEPLDISEPSLTLASLYSVVTKNVGMFTFDPPQ
jgi:hypothetical protein